MKFVQLISITTVYEITGVILRTYKYLLGTVLYVMTEPCHNAWRVSYLVPIIFHGRNIFRCFNLKPLKLYFSDKNFSGCTDEAVSKYEVIFYNKE